MVVLIGASVGEDDLIPIKALKYLKNADVVIYDRLIDMSLLLLCGRKSIFVNVGKTPSGAAHKQNEIQNNINNALEKYGKKYSLVVRLHGGDPFVFGRGGEEIDFLNKHNIKFEVIPAVSSSLVAATYAGIPITHRDYNSSIHIYTAHKKHGSDNILDYKTMAKLNGNLVFLMGSKSVKTISANLINEGKDQNTPIAIIQSVATSKQKVLFSTLKNTTNDELCKDIYPPAVIVIGYGINNKNMWFNKPKANVLFVGEKNSTTRFKNLANNFNYKVIKLPVIKSVFENTYCELDYIKTFNAILFTSVNAVKYFAKHIPFHLLKNTGVKIGSIGIATTKELAKHKINKVGIDFMTNGGSDDLIKKALEYTNDDEHILVATSKDSIIDFDVLNNNYRRVIKPLHIYKNKKKIFHSSVVINEVLGMTDIIIFSSGISVRYFFENFYCLMYNKIKLSSSDKKIFNNYKIFSLGQTAYDELKNLGINSIKPENPNYESLLKCIDKEVNL